MLSMNAVVIWLSKTSSGYLDILPGDYILNERLDYRATGMRGYWENLGILLAFMVTFRRRRPAHTPLPTYSQPLRWLINLPSLTFQDRRVRHSAAPARRLTDDICTIFEATRSRVT